MSKKNYGRRVKSITEKGKVTYYPSASLAKERVGYSVTNYLKKSGQKDKYGRTWEYVEPKGTE